MSDQSLPQKTYAASGQANYYIPVPKDVYSPPLTPLGKNPARNSQIYTTLAPSPELLATNLNSPVLQPPDMPAGHGAQGNMDAFFPSADYYALFQQHSSSTGGYSLGQNGNSGSLQSGKTHPINPVNYATISGQSLGSPDLGMLRVPMSSVTSNMVAAGHSSHFSNRDIQNVHVFQSQQSHANHLHNSSHSLQQQQQQQHHTHHHNHIHNQDHHAIQYYADISQNDNRAFYNGSVPVNGHDYPYEYHHLYTSSSGSHENPALLVSNCGHSHERLYQCTFKGCDKSFDKLSQLRSHTKTHSVEKPFVCDTCQMRFSRNHDLKRHQRIHTGIRPYVCENCGKSFIRLDALSRHLKVNNGRGCKARPLPKKADGSETLVIPLQFDMTSNRM